MCPFLCAFWWQDEDTLNISFFLWKWTSDKFNCGGERGEHEGTFLVLRLCFKALQSAILFQISSLHFYGSICDWKREKKGVCVKFYSFKEAVSIQRILFIAEVWMSVCFMGNLILDRKLTIKHITVVNELNCLCLIMCRVELSVLAYAFDKLTCGEQWTDERHFHQHFSFSAS